MPLSYQYIEQNPKNFYESLFPISELTKEKLKNIYKFDVRPPGPLSFWVMREYTYVKY